jgi:hypothetical protein
MTNAIWFSKAKQYLIVAVSCFIAITALFYLSYICALMNPVFYERIFLEDDMQDCFETISQMLSIEGEPAFSSQSIRNNAVSLSEGIIRYVKKCDMTFSDIIPEEESTVFLNSAVSFDGPDLETDFLKKPKMHPYMLSYFVPGSEAVYLKLQTIQTIYTIIKFLIPLLMLIAFLIILISGRPAQNIRITIIISCAVLLAVSVFIYLFREGLFVYSFEKAVPGISNIFRPFIEKAIAVLFLRSVLICMLAIPVSVIFSIKPFVNTFDRFSKTLAASLVIILGVAFSLYHNEFYNVITNKYKTFVVQKNTDILNKDDEAVHSLVIKLREEDSSEPVRNAKLIIYGSDTSDNPLWISAYSDTNGDARFILPKGSYNLYFDETTLPDDQVSFGTVSIKIDKPGNSWYTLHISNKNQDQ